MCCPLSAWRRWLGFCLLVWGVTLFPGSATWADGPGDNNPATVRRVPTLGVEVPAEVRTGLEQGLAELAKAIDALRGNPAPRVKELLPDVEIFHRAVSDALEFREFFNDKEFGPARELLTQGLERARQLAAGQAPWTEQTGLIVRGYVSKIDGSVQPYGLIVPESYQAKGPHRHRLDLWFHGRGETLSEVNFLVSRQKDRGVFAPTDAFVLHPYGRYCNAFKFAGEIDVLEALAHAQKHYRIDADRIASRGFSMGGAACWQFAVHYPDLFVGATPGAGFSETPEFLRVFQKETLDPKPWEKTLWHWYDCNDWAVNLWHCPTIAYSGENDSQKQAADIMEKALADLGIELVHIIGPQTGHSYHPAARDEIERRFNSIVARGRDRNPPTLHFTTYSLRYNKLHWLTVEGLEEHWAKAQVDAHWQAHNSVDLQTSNIHALTLSFAPGECPFDISQPVSIQVDGKDLKGPRPLSDRSWTCRLVREAGVWKIGSPPTGLRKKPGLQGPIDDAFMDAFVFVTPTGTPLSAEVDRWARGELERASEHWRRQFRGRARLVKDTELTAEDIAGKNLVLWGDPGSNRVLAQIADKLPIRWSTAGISAGDRQFAGANQGLILCAPNPLNPERYVVLNSSFTYREYDYLNNARQVPRLPDWAVIDITTPPGSQYPGKVVAADFFNEQWQLRPAR